jgi:hypothetical protein
MDAVQAITASAAALSPATIMFLFLHIGLKN